MYVQNTRIQELNNLIPYLFIVFVFSLTILLALK